MGVGPAVTRQGRTPAGRSQALPPQPPPHRGNGSDLKDLATCSFCCAEAAVGRHGVGAGRGRPSGRGPGANRRVPGAEREGPRAGESSAPLLPGGSR